MTDIRPIVDAVVGPMRQAMLDYGYGRDTCILAVRTGLDVFGYFGVKAKPLSVNMQIWTPDRLEAAIQGVPHDELPGWAIGAIPRPGDRTGHLVIHLPDHQALVDPSFDQFDRSTNPKRPAAYEGLEACSFAEFNPDGTAYRLPGLIVTVAADNGALGLPGRWWENSGNWGRRDEAIRRRFAAVAIKAVPTLSADCQA